MSDAFGTLADVPIYFDDSAGLTITEVRSRARRLQAEAGCDLLIIDYLQLMSGRQQRQPRAGGLRDLARAEAAGARAQRAGHRRVAALARRRRAAQPHIPMLSDLRESGSIEQDADIVMFIYREELYNPETERKNIAEIHIAKHRNGPIGVVAALLPERDYAFQRSGSLPATQLGVARSDAGPRNRDVRQRSRGPYV